MPKFVSDAFYEGERLVRFKTLRRLEGAILESGYDFDINGKIHPSASGIRFEKDNPPYHASGLYQKLNEFLKEVESQDAARGHMGGIEIKI